MKGLFVIPQGEVARRLEKQKVPVMLFVLLYLLIPVVVYIYMWISHGFSLTSTIFAVVWIAWSVYSWCYLSLTDDEHSVFVSFILTFPIIVPFLIATTIIIRYLMRKYPNTDNPDEILKFKRKTKIKSIL